MSNVNYEIVDVFESIKDDIFIPQDYISINNKLKNFTNYKMSISVPLNGKDLGFDVTSELIKSLRNEMNQHISKIILGELFSTSKFDYVDISDCVNTHTSVNRMIDFVISDYDHKLIITNTQLSNSLCDSAQFHFKKIVSGDGLVNSGIPHCIGSISRYDIYCDPFMRFDDNRICLFDKCEINIENLNHSLIATNTFAPRMVISYDLDYKVGDSKVIFVLDGDESSTSYKQYKQLQRDIKIDSLLDGKEENTL